MRKLTDPLPIRSLWVLVLVSIVFVATPQAVAWAEVENTNQKEKLEFRKDEVKEGEHIKSIHSQTLVYAYNPDTNELKKESKLNRKPVRRLASTPQVQNVVKPPAQPHPTGKKIFTAVAYTSSVDETDADPFTTAAGTKTRWGIVASNVLPLGTRIKISAFGDQVFVVEDRMNARYNGTNTLDIWHHSKAEAYQWGRRQVEVEIL